MKAKKSWEHLRAENNEESVRGLVKLFAKMALSDAGRKVAQRWGVHVADAIDPATYPNESFIKEQLPQIEGLMSESYLEGLWDKSRLETKSLRDVAEGF